MFTHEPMSYWIHATWVIAIGFLGVHYYIEIKGVRLQLPPELLEMATCIYVNNERIR